MFIVVYLCCVVLIVYMYVDRYIYIYIYISIDIYVWITQKFKVQGFITIKEGNVLYSEVRSTVS